MDYTLNRTAVDVLALESQIKNLVEIRQAIEAKSITLHLALEGDALMTNQQIGSSRLVRLHFDSSWSADDHRVALENVIESIWEKIKAFFQKIAEYLKRFWAWLTAQQNKITPEKVEKAETTSKDAAHAMVQATNTVLSVEINHKEGHSMDAVAVEDAGLKGTKPSDILNAIAASNKDHFVSGLSQAEKYILFSPAYTQGLEKLSREFARLKPVDALVKKYKHLSDWTDHALGQAKTLDAIHDFSEYREKLADFKHTFHAESDSALGYDKVAEDAADMLSHDIDHFHGARSGGGKEEFALDIPTTGEAFVSNANTLDQCFRVIKSVFAEVQTATDEVKALEALFDGLSTKLEEYSKQPTEDNHSARDMVLERLQTDTQLVVARIRMIIKGLAIFPTYFMDAHQAIMKYHRFVIRVLDDTVKQLSGEYEFREEQIKSAMAQLRDAANSFARLS